ncbi:MAG TPA: hypothetical protein VGG33_16460 [Polyangia bacterium]
MSTKAAHPAPPPMAAALEHLQKVLVAPEGGAPIDPLTADWATIEKGAVPLLGGAFSPQNPRHLDVVFMLASALAERLSREFGSFWFQNRATPHGATVGFPEGVLVFSPFETVFEALGRAQLAQLDGITGELRGAVARVKGSNPAGRPLGPADYQRIFDPGLVQFVAIDPAAAATALAATGAETLGDFEHGFSKLSPQIPEPTRTQVAREVKGALSRLDQAAKMGDQIPRAPQLLEFVTLVQSGKASTGIAPAEFWEQLLLPLLHVGAAQTFAELDEEELKSYKDGTDPLLLYVDVVPYRTPAADEDGLLGVFPPAEVTLVDGRWGGTPGVRLLGVPVDVLHDLCETFDPTAVRDSVGRFAAACAEAAGGAVAAPTPPEGQPSLLDLVLLLTEDLRRVVKIVDEKGWHLVLRYATETEASSEPVLQDLRRAIREPRIVLA